MRIPSEPEFLTRVRRAMLACVVALALAAFLFPAPLQEAADPGNPPNPARSAWFLLWVQELVSHGTAWIWPAILMAAVLVALPWLPGAGTPVDPGDGSPVAERAPRAGGAIAVACFLLAGGLTLAALFFRGRNWEWRWPF